MPSYIHDTVAEKIGVFIGSWLLELEKSDTESIAELGREVTPAGSSTIKFRLSKGNPDQRMADKIFQHVDCKFPGLVIEVSRSQREASLDKRAEFFIRRSKGQIRTVIGVNLHQLYLFERGRRSTKAPALLSVWKAELRKGSAIARQTIKDQVLHSPHNMIISSF